VQRKLKVVMRRLDGEVRGQLDGSPKTQYQLEGSKIAPGLGTVLAIVSSHLPDLPAMAVNMSIARSVVLI
jgi:hypothetical protein